MKKIAFFAFVLCVANTALWSQPDLVPVKGGVFYMGDAAGNDDEKPVHVVQIADFKMAKTETTIAEFRAFIEATGYVTDAEKSSGSYIWDSLGWHLSAAANWRMDEKGRLRATGANNFPVLHVSWNDAAQYCNWLSVKEKLRSVYLFQGDSVCIDTAARGYRLPTEAEWEYAAAEGVPQKRHPFAGKGGLATLGWYAGNSKGAPHPVAQKTANLLGIYDLSGNVWEWCHGWYNARSNAPAAKKERSIRGGSWNNNPAHCRIANRTSRYGDFRDGGIGFRVVVFK